MKLFAAVAAIGAVAGLVLAALVIKPTAAYAAGAGKKAPDFSAKGTDGKTHTLKSLTGDKALVLYFISWSCPINEQAVPYYKEIAKAYKGKVNFVGVVDGHETVFKQWNRNHKVPFNVLYDPGQVIIDSYKAKASPWVIVINTEGEIEKTYKGYSEKSLQDLSGIMASHTKGEPAKINLEGAPSYEAYG
ncbi:MAG: redoxin domain-containing protein [Armatimonadetes bacterium]|nr:redoxin domain-containing protein [Armatimonadota bacterium]